MSNVFRASLLPSNHHAIPTSSPPSHPCFLLSTRAFPATLQPSFFPALTHDFPAAMTFFPTLHHPLHSCLKKFNFALYIFVLPDVSNKCVWKDLLPALPSPPPTSLSHSLRPSLVLIIYHRSTQSYSPRLCLFLTFYFF